MVIAISALLPVSDSRVGFFTHPEDHMLTTLPAAGLCTDVGVTIAQDRVFSLSPVEGLDHHSKVAYRSPSRKTFPVPVDDTSCSLRLDLREALDWLEQQGIQADPATYALILRRCGSARVLLEGKRVHGLLVRNGHGRNLYLGNLAVEMYGKCDSLQDARLTFDRMSERNVYSWNLMLAAYCKHGRTKEALEFFEQMHIAGEKPDSFTYSTILGVCCSSGFLATGKDIHVSTVNGGLDLGVFVGTALVNMYAKCGSLEDAKRVFFRIYRQDLVLWTAMISAYAQHGLGNDAIHLFKRLVEKGMKPDRPSFVCVLRACANISSLEEGRSIHEKFSKSGLLSDVVLETALISMYGKCGKVHDARKVFDKVQKTALVTWNAMIAAYAQHGEAREVSQLFTQMQLEGLKPDDVTYIEVLSTCSRAGLVLEACFHFASMQEEHAITPALGHYGCMIDLFGRAGLLEEAETIILEMPLPPDALAWQTLLGACRIHGDVERGLRAAKQVFELLPVESAPYVLLSNIHMAEGMWADVLSWELD